MFVVVIIIFFLSSIPGIGLYCFITSTHVFLHTFPFKGPIFKGPILRHTLLPVASLDWLPDTSLVMKDFNSFNTRGEDLVLHVLIFLDDRAIFWKTFDWKVLFLMSEIQFC